MMMTKGILASIAFAAMFGLTASASLGGPIEERQELMKANGKTMKLLGAMAQGESPFDAAVVKEQAEAMAARYETEKSLFPPGSDKGPPETYAKAEVWSDPDGFAALMNKAIEASHALAAVSDQAKLGEALGAVGNVCKDCHEKYTRPKD
jgi:cytochrome c556